jgi:hypothetical protein
VNHHDGRYVRLRYTATGALAALAVVGAIAGTVALAASPATKSPGHAASVKCPAARISAAPAAGKAAAPPPGSDQPFLADVRHLVDDGTISASQGQVLDGEIEAGRVDTQTLASSGFTPAQLAAVQRALSDTKRSLASAAGPSPRGSK